MPNNNTVSYFYTSAHKVPCQWLHLHCSHCHHNKCHTQCFIIASSLRVGWSGVRYLARANYFSLLQNDLRASGTHPGSVHWVPVTPYSEVNSPVVKLTTDLHRMQRWRTSRAIYLLAQCAFMVSTRKTSLCLVCMFCLHYVCFFTFPSIFFLFCISYSIVLIIAVCCHIWYKSFTCMWLTRF